jgi:hypothetical protein
MTVLGRQKEHDDEKEDVARCNSGWSGNLRGFRLDGDSTRGL